MTIKQFFKSKNQTQGLFRALGWSAPATEAVLLLLQMQIFYGKPVHPSYGWIADQTGCCPKTVARAVAQLKAQGLVKVRRLMFRGRRSVNSIDLGKLIYLIRKALGAALYRRPTWVSMTQTARGILVKFCFAIRVKNGNYKDSWHQGEFLVTCFRRGKTSTLWRRYWYVSIGL